MARSTTHGSSRLVHFPPSAGLQWGRALQRSPSWIFGSEYGMSVGLSTWPTGRNWLVLGPPRSGKGASFFVPTLLSAGDQPDPKPSILITDPKGELLAISRQRLEGQGYKIHVVAFDQPDLSDGFDPLPWLSSEQFGGIDYGAAQHLAQTIIPIIPNEKDPFWSNAARTIVASSVVMAFKTGGTFADALGLAYQLALSSSDKLVQQVAALRTVDQWAAAQVQGLVNALANDAKLAGNIGADLIARFSQWTTPAMLSIFSRPSFRWDEVLEGDQPHAAFVVAASHHSEQQAVVIASLVASAHRLQRKQNRLNRPFWVLLDEFGNVGHLPNLLDALTTLPGAGVSIAMGLQSIPQVASVYGDQPAKVALEALHGMTVFPGLGFDSASWVSDRLGQMTVSTWAKSTAADNSRQWTKGEHQRRVMMPDEIMTMRSGSIVIQRAGYYGLLSGSQVYYRGRKYRQEAVIADPNQPQIARMLDGMRHELTAPPGAWDLGERLLDQLLPQDEATNPDPDPAKQSPKSEPKPASQPETPPQTQTGNLLTNLLSGGSDSHELES